MEIHDFFIFERTGSLLFHRAYSREEEGAGERGKLVYGVLFSLKQMIPALSPTDQILEEGIRSLTTRAFTLHCYESATGYRFALVTSVANQAQQAEIRNILERIFSELFVELVMMDPTYVPRTVIDSPVFTKAVANSLQTIT